MKKLVFLLLIGNIAHSQGFTSVDLIYGSRLHNASFNKLNTLNNYNFNYPVQIAGIAFSPEIPLDGKPKTFVYTHLSYNQVIPNTLVIKDSISTNLTGNIFGWAWGFVLRSNSKHFHIGIGLGMDWGRIKLFNAEFIQQKNAFLSPLIIIHPKIRTGKFVMSFPISYGWDLSKPNWKNIQSANGGQILLENFKQSGLTASLCVGYVLW